MTEPTPANDHDGRPVDPAYVQRGQALMAQWAEDHAFEDAEKAARSLTA